MAVDKRISYINQDGYKNYIKNSDSITIPKKFKARKKATSTHLAYITKAEAAQLKKQNKGTPHKGPKGIPSYDDFDAQGNYSTGAEMSAAETGGSGHGMSESKARDIRLGAVAAGAQGSKDEMRAARDEFGRSYRGRDRRTGLGGLLGGIGRGLLGFFGGIPGKVMSGILSARNLAKRTGTKIGEFGEEVEEFGNYPTLDRYLNRHTDKYKDKPYRGQGQGYDMSDAGQGNIAQDPDLYKDEMKEFRINNPVDLTNANVTNNNANVTNNNQFVEEEEDFNPNFLAPGSAEGGRIGYGLGDIVKGWFSGGPESETNPTLFGTQNSLMNKTAINNLENAIGLYETQIENADQLGHLSKEDMLKYELAKKQLEALIAGSKGQAEGGLIGYSNGGIARLL